jgi:hypothetical protein
MHGGYVIVVYLLYVCCLADVERHQSNLVNSGAVSHTNSTL